MSRHCVNVGSQHRTSYTRAPLSKGSTCPYSISWLPSMILDSGGSNNRPFSASTPGVASYSRMSMFFSAAKLESTFWAIASISKTAASHPLQAAQRSSGLQRAVSAAGLNQLWPGQTHSSRMGSSVAISELNPLWLHCRIFSWLYCSDLAGLKQILLDNTNFCCSKPKVA